MEKKSAKGYSLVELMVVMAIIVILGTMLVTMMNIGGKLYRNSNAVMEAQSNVRLAMSYITMRIRQNDALNKIDVDNVSVEGSTYVALTIIDSDNPNNTYWIYFDNDNKKLMELNVSTGSTSTSEIGEVIADISNSEITRDPPKDLSVDPPIDPPIQTIKIKVTSTDGKVYSSQVSLRSQ